MQQIKKSADESIEGYKARLENASNSWLLASATTLGQSSQAVMDTLSKSAEKRLREVCAEVLAGMGDTLKERLLGISTASQRKTKARNPKRRSEFASTRQPPCRFRSPFSRIHSNFWPSRLPL